jgi:hypothetical protein
LFDGGHDPLGFVVESSLAAEVEDPGVAAEDGGDDPGLARDASGLAGADGFSGVEVGW